MGSFTDDLNSPLPKQMMDDVRPSSLPTNDCAASNASRVEGRPVIALRPSSELLGRITLKRRTLAIAIVSSEDPFRNLCDDILGHILARVPLFSLKVAKKVCKRWASVTSTPEFDILHKELNPRLFLIRYGINTLDPKESQWFAYDVEDNAWVTLPALQMPAHNEGSLTGASGVVFAISGPGQDRLWYKLTRSFGETWYETPVMKFPRSEPVVSVALGVGMGHKVVVAGGGSRVHSAVEVFDSEIGTWESYGDLPEEFKNYNSRAWMSGVMCDNKFYMSSNYKFEIGDVQIHFLDLYTKQWASIQLECPVNLFFSRILAIGTTLVVAGFCNTSDGHFAVKLWKVDLKTLSLIQIGLMPTQLLVMGEGLGYLTFVTYENLVYVFGIQLQQPILAEVSLEDCKTYWHPLPELPLNFLVKWNSIFFASISSA